MLTFCDCHRRSGARWWQRAPRPGSSVLPARHTRSHNDSAMLRAQCRSNLAVIVVAWLLPPPLPPLRRRLSRLTSPLSSRPPRHSSALQRGPAAAARGSAAARGGRGGGVARAGGPSPAPFSAGKRGKLLRCILFCCVLPVLGAVFGAQATRYKTWRVLAIVPAAPACAPMTCCCFTAVATRRCQSHPPPPDRALCRLMPPHRPVSGQARGGG